MNAPNNSTLYRETFLLALARIAHCRGVEDPHAEVSYVSVADVEAEIGHPGDVRYAVRSLSGRGCLEAYQNPDGGVALTLTDSGMEEAERIWGTVAVRGIR